MSKIALPLGVCLKREAGVKVSVQIAQSEIGVFQASAQLGLLLPLLPPPGSS